MSKAKKKRVIDRTWAHSGGAESESGQGAVIVFRGGPRGVDKTPSQVIRAADFDTKIRGFGFSISGGTDLDGNG